MSMSQQEKWRQVDDYFTEQLLPSDTVLDQVLKHNEEAGLPAIDVSPSQGKMLHLLARMQGARRILEIGTLGGYSTIWLARALPADGQLITLELSPQHAEVAQRNLTLAGLDHKVDIRIGNALDSLAVMEKEKIAPFDLIFLDADKPNNPHYLKWALAFARPGTVLIADNVVRGGEVANPDSTDPSVEGTQLFFDLLRRLPQVSATAIQTVGSKGYDGFVLAIIN